MLYFALCQRLRLTQQHTNNEQYNAMHHCGAHLVSLVFAQQQAVPKSRVDFLKRSSGEASNEKSHARDLGN
jgi:hypothetical protein